jgi:rhodanese-related sulfurtransferase
MFAFGSARAVNISPVELQQRIEKGEKPVIVDVREPWEYAEGHIPGSVLRPLGQIRAWASEFKTADELVLVCRTASRSAAAYRFLQSQGFTNLKNMSGGMVMWRGKVAR